MLENGYIKIYRSMLGWEWYQDGNTARVFLHLLLTANYEPQKWRGIEIQRGQRIASYRIIADELRLSVQNVRTALKHLISTGEVTHITTSEYGLFTVNNYDRFQTLTPQTTDDQQSANSRLTPGQQQRNKANKANKAEESKNTPLPPASEEDAPQARGVSILEQRFNEFWELFPKKTAKQDAFKAWSKLKPDKALFMRIMDAIRAQSGSHDWKKENGRYIPYPASWLNGGRWDDVITGGLTDGDNEQRAGFTPKPITQADLPGFHNALDRYDDEGNRIDRDGK